MVRKSLFLFIFLFCVGYTSGQIQFLNPFLNPQECNVKKGMRLCDPSRLLHTEEVTNVDNAIRYGSYREQNRKCRGVEIAVYLEEFLDSGLTAEQQCKTIMDQWRVGDEECQNGVLIYMATRSRKIHICTGKGAMEAPNRLTDGKLERMINYVKPLLREQEYPKAAETLCVRIRKSIWESRGSTYESDDYINGSIFTKLWMTIGEWFSAFGTWIAWLLGEEDPDSDYSTFSIGIFVWLCLFGYQQYRRSYMHDGYSLCKKKLNELQQQKAEAQAKKFKTLQGSCPICLEEFKKVTQENKRSTDRSGESSKSTADSPKDSCKKNDEREDPIIQEADSAVCEPVDMTDVTDAGGLRQRPPSNAKLVKEEGDVTMKNYDSDDEDSPEGGKADDTTEGMSRILIKAATLNSSPDTDKSGSTPNDSNVADANIDATAAFSTSSKSNVYDSTRATSNVYDSAVGGSSAKERIHVDRSKLSSKAGGSKDSKTDGRSAKDDADERPKEEIDESLVDQYENIKILTCGHAFHIDCLDGWEQSSTLCPVCKQPQGQTVDESGRSLAEDYGNTSSSSGTFGGGTRTTPGTSSSSSTFGGVGIGMNNMSVMHQQDYNFRLTRLHHYYPDYITTSLFNRWSSPGYTGSPATDVDFVRSQPSYQGPSSSSVGSGSGWGSNVSFGGGSSFGGGGSGGSW